MVLTNERLEYGRQPFQSGGRNVPSVKTMAEDPKPSKGLGLFTYRGFDCIAVPANERFSVIILNAGHPIKVEWIWPGDGKMRDSWGTVSLAKLNAKIFIRYHIKKKRVSLNEDGKSVLRLRGSAT